MRRRISTSDGYKRAAVELQIHIAVADFLRIAAHPHTIWYHPANEGARSEAAGAKLKRMGMLPGVADFALTLPDGRSAFMEVKTDDGKQSLEQLAFQSRCYEARTPYEVVRSLDEARATLKKWGALRERMD